MAKKKKLAKRRRPLWKPEEIALLKKLFPNNPTAKISKQLRRKTDAVKKKASRMGLRKTKRYMKSLGRD